MTYIISGSIIPFYTEKVNCTIIPAGLTGTSNAAWTRLGSTNPSTAYFFHLSVGRKGLFSLYPVLLLSIGHFFFVTSKMRWNTNRIALAVFAVFLPIYGWGAWEYNQDSNLPFYTTLVYYFLFALAPVVIVTLLVRASQQSSGEDKPELPLETVAMGIADLCVDAVLHLQD